ncbi:MAG: UDP-N-acetylmuramoyl-tripeptide--D-alanyl-D-alanine ligase [Chthoniobacterales bacterium]
MNPTPLKQIAEMAGATLEGGDGSAIIASVSTDSRTITSDQLFVALRGDNFDAHNFVENVAKAGAKGAIVDRTWKGSVPPEFALLRVDDTLRGYQDLAANYRKSLGLKVLAITGSNGKTSTKDFSGAVLARKFRVTKTEGNFNNHVGLPRTILEATSEDDIGVWEIGMNHPGEIAPLAKIAQPDAAIITNIGVAHIEFMGSREAIADEKAALAEAVPPNGWLILNADDPFTGRIAPRTSARVILAGTTSGSLRASDISQSPAGSDFTILEGAHRCRARLPVPGLHMIQNALFAVAAGRAFGISLEEAAGALSGAPLSKARLQVKNIGGVQFLDDSYNANPDSVKAALRTLVELEADGDRIAVLGEMRELGAETERGHREVGEKAASFGVDHLIAIGETGRMTVAAAQRAGLKHAVAVNNTTEAAELLEQIAKAGDLVLIKGSRTARTERVLEEFSRRQLEGARS